jgi:hypothetical protein
MRERENPGKLMCDFKDFLSPFVIHRWEHFLSIFPYPAWATEIPQFPHFATCAQLRNDLYRFPLPREA